jgi:3-dehydroquinate dehydratase/shikimate dehydrogenase
MGVRICPVVTCFDDNVISIANKFKILELRIDLVGSLWVDVASRIRTDWIATCRRRDQGGAWSSSEIDRVNVLVEAVKRGARFVDIEDSLSNLHELVRVFKSMGALVIVSHHDFNTTPEFSCMVDIVRREIEVGADIWKISTTANSFTDCLNVLRLLKLFRNNPGIALAMGSYGVLSRVLSPLLNGFLTYASVRRGEESAPGQLTVDELMEIYELIGVKVDRCED